MHDSDREAFIGEPIQPEPGSFDGSMMARGGPGIPRVFTWRGEQYEVLGVIDTWTSRERGKGTDRDHTYIRRHFYRVKTATGETMTLEFDRKPHGPRGRQRWSVLSLDVGDGNAA